MVPIFSIANIISNEAYQEISYESQEIFVTAVKAWAGNIYKTKTRSKPDDIIVEDSTEIQFDPPIDESEPEGSKPDSEPCAHTIETVKTIETIETIETIAIKNLQYPCINFSQEYFIMKPVE